MAVFGLAVTGVTMALTDNYVAAEGYSDALQSGRGVMMRVQSAARKAKLITATTATSLVFWAGDTNGDGTINLDELKMVTWNQQAKEIREVAVVFPPGTPNVGALNVTEPLSAVTTVAAASSVIAADTHCTTTVLAGDVTDFQVTVLPAAPLSTRVNIQLTLGQGSQKLTISSSARLRADSTANVGLNGSTWVLAPP
jgi:hypothetical protein